MTPEIKKANDRFIKVMVDCISKKECKNRVDFAKKLKSTPATITHIASHTHNIPYLVLFEARKVFNISINYVLFGEGPPFMSDSKGTNEDLLNRVVKDLVSRVSELEKKQK